MSKAFTRESDTGADDRDDDQADALPAHLKNYVTPAGHAALQAELRRLLVAGAAGFIGFHVARRLLAEGRAVVGLDNLNDYYDPALKRSRAPSANARATSGDTAPCCSISSGATPSSSVFAALE